MKKSIAAVALSALVSGLLVAPASAHNQKITDEAGDVSGPLDIVSSALKDSKKKLKLTVELSQPAAPGALAMNETTAGVAGFSLKTDTESYSVVILEHAGEYSGHLYSYTEESHQDLGTLKAKKKGSGFGVVVPRSKLASLTKGSTVEWWSWVMHSSADVADPCYDDMLYGDPASPVEGAYGCFDEAPGHDGAAHKLSS